MPQSHAELFNAAQYLVHRRVARGGGARVAIVHPGGELSYRELAEQVQAVAAGLRALGVRPEERVLFFSADCPEMVAGILGVLHLGAVAVPVSTMLTEHDLASLLADSRARVLITSADFVETARASVARLTGAGVTGAGLTGAGLTGAGLTGGGLSGDLSQVLTIGAPADGFPVASLGWAGLLAAGADPSTGRPGAPAVYPTWPDSPALWLYTSGTTGNPKAAMHRHADIRFVCESYGQQVLGIRPEDRCLSVAKLFFAYGIGNSVFFPFSVGATTILEPGRPTPERFAEVARAHRATLFFGVPTFYASMLASPVADDSFGTVRQGASAGEPLPATLFSRVRDRFGFEILDGIGSTEALHIFVSNVPGAIRPGSSGTPVPGYRVELRDELDGTVIGEPDHPGALYVSGESVATGYWCRAETSRRAFQGEWLRTGDTYQRNTDGTYSYLGRTDDMIKAGGIWVSPSEVEARLQEHPDVLEVAVVGMPDVDGLDKPVAAVVLCQGASAGEAELVEFCRAGLAAFKRPRRVVVLDELPKTATGKLQRYLVRALVAGPTAGAPGTAGPTAGAGAADLEATR